MIADWDKVVNVLIKGECTPPEGKLPYKKSSFIIKDGFHPNMLSGNIASVKLYSVLTGQPAAQLPTDVPEYRQSIMVEDHLNSSYERGEMDSNFHTVLTMENELASIRKLIDQYLAKKPYLQN